MPSRFKLLGVLGSLTLAVGIGPVHGAVFTLNPASSVAISGSISLDISGFGQSLSGTGTLVEQGAGSLTTALVGSIDATSSAGNVVFAGGNLATVPTGNWEPSNLPSVLGFQVNIPLSGTISGWSAQVRGSFRDFVLAVTGTSSLSGAPGNQSFDASTLSLNLISGVLDVQATLCTPNCDDAEIVSLDLFGDPEPMVGTGTLVRNGNVDLLTLPLVLIDDESVTETDQGVTFTVSGAVALNGSVIAAAPVPEPATWAMFALGLLAVVASARRKLSS